MGWTPQQLCSRADIIDTHHRYALGIDRRDWLLFRSVFADRIHLDFSAWHGGEPLEIDADDWVKQVAARQSGFDATQHQMTNHTVTLTGTHAECITYIIARHYIRDGDCHHIQAIGGYYRNRLVKADNAEWKITHATLNLLWTHGSRALFDVARLRHEREHMRH